MSDAATQTAGGMDKAAAVEEYILHHVMDSQDAWHPLPFLHIHLPEWISLHGVMVLLCGALLLLIFGKLYRKGAGAPRGLTNALEVFVVFIRDEISIANLGEKDGRAYAPLFCSMFFFILGLNLLGLIPLFATATGNVSVTAAMATVTFFFMTVVAVMKNGPVNFVKAFIPHGVPWPVLILVTPLEMMGLVIKCFALTIRLFANMLAGHIVVFSLIGLSVSFGAAVAPAAVALATGIYLMEIFIALLQAYIFTLLSAMFIGQVWHPAH